MLYMKMQRDHLGDHSFKHERQQRDHPGNQSPVQLHILYSDNLIDSCTVRALTEEWF